MSQSEQLENADRAVVTGWLGEYLAWHIEEWSRLAGWGWSKPEVQAHVDHHRLAERDWDELIGASENPDHFVRVSRRNGKPEGLVYARSRMDPFLQERVGQLSWIYVDPSHRGTGLGDDLMAAAKQWMRERGLRMSEVFVTASNRSAVDLYQRAGYQLADFRMFAPLSETKTSQPQTDPAV